MCMMPTQTAALSDIPPHLISRATSVTSIIRNVASSFGIAAMTVLLTQRNGFHTARMTETLGPDNVAYTDWITANPVAGHAVITGHVAQQSFVFAIQDVFLLTAAFTLLAIVPALFLKKISKPKSAAEAPAAVME